MSDKTVTTASGATISAADVEQIKKDARKDTVRNILAAIGLFAVGAFALGVINARKDAKNQPQG